MQGNCISVSEETLMQSFRAGNALAFQQLKRMFYHVGCCFAYRQINNMSEAEDIVADIFEKMWVRKKDCFEKIDNVKSFLFKCIRNACINYSKRLKQVNYAKKEILYLTEEEDITNDQQLKNQLLSEALKEIEEMPDQMGRIFTMSYVDEMDAAAIARCMNLSVDTVRVQKSRAVKRLKGFFLKKVSA